MEPCPVCNHVGPPYVSKQLNSTGWILVVVLFIFTCIFFFIPFLVDSLKDEVHVCSNCGAKLRVV